MSLNAQYRYIFAVKHASAPAMIEAAGLDAGMVIFSLLALGLARAGQSARTERALILACALASAAMNYEAAGAVSLRSLAAYVMPPVFLAVVVDRVIAVVRRWVAGDAERSAWAALGDALLAAARLADLGLLYPLRLVLDPATTAKGIRYAVLHAAPLPGTVCGGYESPDCRRLFSRRISLYARAMAAAMRAMQKATAGHSRRSASTAAPTASTKAVMPRRASTILMALRRTRSSSSPLTTSP